MAGLSRDKGKAGERELARLLSDLTGHQITRRVRQHDGDDDLVGLAGWSIECKRYARASPALVAGWWRQAQAQALATNTVPVLLYRADRADWVAVWPACLHTGDTDATHCLSAAPAVWWAMVQGHHPIKVL